MKSIEEIEKLGIEELEAASAQSAVPEGFRRRIEETLLSEEALADGSGTGRKAARLSEVAAIAAFAAAAAVAAVLLMQRPSELRDSFDDPRLAYAQVEQTFRFISDKMSGGIDMVREAGPVAGKPEEIIQKINSK